jgi:dUTP pyrophosphatase
MPQLKVKLLHPDAILPAKAHHDDAGFDLFSVENTVLPPGDWARVNTGIAIALPHGTVGLVCPRSGMAMNDGITVLNAPGVVDAGYRGEVSVILINHGIDSFLVQPKMKIAQLVVQLVVELGAIAVDELEESDRGSGGFGSTGV